MDINLHPHHQPSSPTSPLSASYNDNYGPHSRSSATTIISEDTTQCVDEYKKECNSEIPRQLWSVMKIRAKRNEPLMTIHCQRRRSIKIVPNANRLWHQPPNGYVANLKKMEYNQKYVRKNYNEFFIKLCDLGSNAKIETTGFFHQQNENN